MASDAAVLATALPTAAAAASRKLRVTDLMVEADLIDPHDDDAIPVMCVPVARAPES